MNRLKFKLKKDKGSVSGFTDAEGIVHVPGDVVDLPASYLGDKWLERLEKDKAVKAPPAKMEKIEKPAEAVPLSAKKPKKSPAEEAPVS